MVLTICVQGKLWGWEEVGEEGRAVPIQPHGQTSPCTMLVGSCCGQESYSKERRESNHDGLFPMILEGEIQGAVSSIR